MNDNITKSIRETYDRLAAAYTSHFFNELEHKPLDPQLLHRFAAEVGQDGQVCDMACGPGHITRYLRAAGTNIFGLDLSPCMIEQAQRLNPDISFREGNMMALDLPDRSLAGIVAFYAIVNLPKESLPAVFREMERVLQPSGLLLLAFHIGDEISHPDEVLGQPVSMDWFFFQPIDIVRYLEVAGFAIVQVIAREPYPAQVEYQSRRAYIFARKPAAMVRQRPLIP